MLDECCPLCTEELDPTDYLLANRLCQCHYAVCLWCFRRITEDAAKDSRPALCPNCREPYDIERITREGRELNPQQLEEVKRKKGKQEERKKPSAAAGRPRKDLANVRVVQRNLVYVVGLPMDICYEDTLLSADYIGQYGKVVKISVSRSGPYGSVAAKNGPTGSAYITFRRVEDARRCIESIHGTTWDGKLVKACYGTTKYCNAFLKGLPCNNAECLYLHDVAAEEDSYTKEETKSTKFVNLVHAASLNQASAVANGQPHGTTSAELSAAVASLDASQAAPSQAAADAEVPAGQEDENTNGANWPSLRSNAWLGKSAPTSVPVQAVPPAEDPQAWPGLPGGRSGTASSAEASENESETTPGKPPLAKPGATMADKIARASSSPAAGKAPESSKKKLTPLHGRAKQGAAVADGQADANGADGKPSGGQESGRVSPPWTPQPARKSAAGHQAAAAVGADAQSSEAALPSLAPAAGKEQEEAESSAAGASRPPPGFTAPAASKPKLVTPPPGFAHVSQESNSRYASPYQSFGSDTSSPAQVARPLAEQVPKAASQSPSLQSIWGSSSSLDASSFSRPPPAPLSAHELLPQAQPRARSRFQFANDESEPPQPASHQRLLYEQPRTPEQLGHGSYGSFGGLHSSLYHSSSGSAIPAVYQPQPGGQDWSHLQGHHLGFGLAVTEHGKLHQQAKAENEDSLPAGLVLLRKMQAQGGLSRSRNSDGGGTQQLQHGIYSDPAILSARARSDHGRSWLDQFGSTDGIHQTEETSKGTLAD